MSAPTSTVTVPTGTRRLLADAPDVPVPHLDVEELLALAEHAGLTGRGGAGFPTVRKIHAVAGRSPVVVANAMEGEPLSWKDAVLLDRSPGLVVDGLSLVGAALGARRTILATGPEVASEKARAAARGTRVEVLDLVGGFVAGQESALVNQLDGRAGVPSDPLVPVRTKGVDGRPTLVLNAETLAHLALAARYGAAWFREAGTPGDPGTFLVTVTGSTDRVVRSPGVLEVARGVPLRQVLAAAGTDPERVAAVLVGGYHGAWVGDLDALLTTEDLRRFGATPGAGILHVLDRDTCPLQVAADVATWLAGQSARQCGPCVNGLPRMAETLRALARPGAHPRLLDDVERLRGLVQGRGACTHPDGTARFVASTVALFADHVTDHLEGHCDARARRLDAV